jgi:iron-sulfur cluster repair protein YtfE (RIC family)
MEIDASTKVGAILRDYPELTDWFMELGLCGCGHDSNMMWTLERLAKEKNMDVAALLDDINERIA